MEQLKLIDKDLPLEKFPGKGGWTYVYLSDINQDQHNDLRWKKVKGHIDSYEITEQTLMPMGKGQLFITVNAAIRKQIAKQVGDQVRVILYALEAPQPEIVPEDFFECLKDEPAAWKSFKKLSEAEQQEFINWIMGTPLTQTRIQRMADAINNLATGRSFRSATR